MIYLDNAATGGFKPPAVQNAVRASMQLCANAGRSGHRLSLACAEHVLACRKLLSELFCGYGYERVVFTKNCTEALDLAILGTLKRGDHAVCSCFEHNSVYRPLAHLAREGVITFDVAPPENNRISIPDILSLVRENTAACCVTAASNVTGSGCDLAELRRALPKHVLLIVDGAQGAGHIPIKMKSWGIDALALAGHKGLHAIQGAGALLFSDRMQPRPLLFGGTGSESADPEMPAYYPDRLESGTLSYPAICSLFEGALIVKAHQKEHGERLMRLTGALRVAMDAMQGFTPYFEPNPCGIASFKHERLSSDRIADLLSDKFDIAVRGGLHCAPLAHKALGTFPEGLVRASFSPFQSMREVNALVNALKKISATCV